MPRSTSCCRSFPSDGESLDTQPHSTFSHIYHDNTIGAGQSMEESAEVYRNYRIQGTGRDTSKSLRLIWELAGQDFPVLAHDGGMEAFQPVRVWMAKLYQMFFYKYVHVRLSMHFPVLIETRICRESCQWR
jgi:hypothetical protein